VREDGKLGWVAADRLAPANTAVDNQEYRAPGAILLDGSEMLKLAKK
jgi:hypothetical protein